MNQEKVGASIQGALFKRRRYEIPDAERVSTLQEKLYQKAKQERESLPVLQSQEPKERQALRT